MFIFFLKVWDACTDSSINLQSDDGEEVAILVENDLVQASLTKNLKDYANLKVFYASQIKDFKKVDENGKECVQIQMSNNETIRSNLLIGKLVKWFFLRLRIKFIF
jgi:2-polyprenyl-6-methoxyphenol hydroxylase-like FAD-dependent oxidoreductase